MIHGSGPLYGCIWKGHREMRFKSEATEIGKNQGPEFTSIWELAECGGVKREHSKEVSQKGGQNEGTQSRAEPDLGGRFWEPQPWIQGEQGASLHNYLDEMFLHASFIIDKRRSAALKESVLEVTVLREGFLTNDLLTSQDPLRCLLKWRFPGSTQL